MNISTHRSLIFNNQSESRSQSRSESRDTIVNTPVEKSYRQKGKEALSTSPTALLYNTKHRYSIISNESSYSDVECDKRKRIMMEIVETEIRYVDDLLFIRNYRDPLLDVSGSSNEIIARRTIQDIFAGYESILAVNQELRSQLETRLKIWDGLDQVGDIFINLSPFLKVYSMFLANFNNSMRLVNDLMIRNLKFSSFVQDINLLPDSRGLGLQAFMVTPVQRIPRYKLLIEDMLRKTPADHPDYENLTTALELISGIALSVNETIRSHEMILKMLDIQKSLVGLKQSLLVPGRKFIKSGKVIKISRRNHQTRQLFLFSDCLVYASPGIIDYTFNFHRLIALENLNFQGFSYANSDVKNSFQIVNRDKSFAVYTESKEERNSWLAEFKAARSKWRNDSGTLKKENPPLQGTIEDFDAPVWMPNEQAKSCLICNKEFTFFLRRHHCRSCGIIVCHPCSRNSFIVPSIQGDRTCRVCQKCLPSLIQEKKFKVHIPTIGDTIEDRVSIDSRRFSIDSVDTQRSSMDSGFTRLYSRRRNSKSLDLTMFYERLIGTPATSEKKCSLCLSKFSFALWKYKCHKCSRPACNECCKKESDGPICDPCSKNIDPVDVVVSPDGGLWSARFNWH